MKYAIRYREKRIKRIRENLAENEENYKNNTITAEQYILRKRDGLSAIGELQS